LSNRTLIEINHDFAEYIDSVRFRDALWRYLRSADRESAEDLERFGVRVFGMRHHSDAYDINWGGVMASEPSLPTR
jgi:hypothetical protein